LGDSVELAIEASFQARFDAATERVAAANRELVDAMSELKVSQRCDKRMVSERLRLAMRELASARTILATLVAAGA
jgi:hypothetical protein